MPISFADCLHDPLTGDDGRAFLTLLTCVSPVILPFVDRRRGGRVAGFFFPFASTFCSSRCSKGYYDSRSLFFSHWNDVPVTRGVAAHPRHRRPVRQKRQSRAKLHEVGGHSLCTRTAFPSDYFTRLNLCLISCPRDESDGFK